MVSFSVEAYVEQKGSFSVDIFNKGQLSSEKMELEDLLIWTKSQLLVISDQALAEEQAKGFDKKPLLLVDGSRTKNLSDVNPLGQIEYVAKQDLGDILTIAMDSVLALSKVKSGEYKAAHRVTLNGQEVADSMAGLQKWLDSSPEIRENDIIRIVNTQPYARKLELLGVTSERSAPRKVEKKRKGVKTGIFMKKPNGAYQLTYRKLQQYKKNLSVNFQFIPGSQLGLKKYTDKKGREKDAKFKKGGRTYLYPSIVFKLNRGGLS